MRSENPWYIETAELAEMPFFGRNETQIEGRISKDMLGAGDSETVKTLPEGPPKLTP